MAKGGFRGFPGMGGMGNMGNIMAQAQKMQRDLEIAQNEVNLLRIDGTAGGDMVKITLGGDHKIYGLEIKKDVIDPEDPEMLTDLITAAYNAALEELEKQKAEKMDKVTGGVKMPF
ncbi:MAG: YbaB/EbfC family nucleoid-associated protein [Clostridiales bacterium]|nr:YbaB/EbfC family nucleoid-associated protein [Clostridiales bacterium]